MVRAKHAAELLVEHVLCGIAQLVAFLVPASQSCHALWRLVVLVVLDHLGEHLQPVGVALEVRLVELLDFVLSVRVYLNLSKTNNILHIPYTHFQFSNDRCRPPAVFQRYVGKIAVRMVAEVQNLVARPAH